MANILTYIEWDGTAARPASLAALNHGREIATEVGATLYALLPCASTPSYGTDDIIAVLSRHGADKVILVTHPTLVQPAFFASHGEALKAACRQFPTRLFLFADTSVARDLAPRLAMILGAHYTCGARLERSSDGFHVARSVFRRRLLMREPVEQADGPLVATLTVADDPRLMGDDDAEVVVIHAPAASAPVLEIVEQLERGTDPCSKRLAVMGGAGLADTQGFDLLRRLADALDAVILASHAAVEQELAPPEQLAGLDGAAVEADLCLAFGVHGDEPDLSAFGPGTGLVAIHEDADAPIHRVASHSLLGDARQVINELLGGLERGGAG